MFVHGSLLTDIDLMVVVDWSVFILCFSIKTWSRKMDMPTLTRRQEMDNDGVQIVEEMLTLVS